LVSSGPFHLGAQLAQEGLIRARGQVAHGVQITIDPGVLTRIVPWFLQIRPDTLADPSLGSARDAELAGNPPHLGRTLDDLQDLGVPVEPSDSTCGKIQGGSS